MRTINDKTKTQLRAEFRAAIRQLVQEEVWEVLQGKLAFCRKGRHLDMAEACFTRTCAVCTWRVSVCESCGGEEAADVSARHHIGWFAGETGIRMYGPAHFNAASSRDRVPARRGSKTAKKSTPRRKRRHLKAVA